jgi:hypothetical protein
LAILRTSPWMIGHIICSWPVMRTLMHLL